jgi:hypothetical protein
MEKGQTDVFMECPKYLGEKETLGVPWAIVSRMGATLDSRTKGGILL